MLNRNIHSFPYSYDSIWLFDLFTACNDESNQNEEKTTFSGIVKQSPTLEFWVFPFQKTLSLSLSVRGLSWLCSWTMFLPQKCYIRSSNGVCCCCCLQQKFLVTDFEKQIERNCIRIVSTLFSHLNEIKLRTPFRFISGKRLNHWTVMCFCFRNHLIRNTFRIVASFDWKMEKTNKKLSHNHQFQSSRWYFDTLKMCYKAHDREVYI